MARVLARVRVRGSLASQGETWQKEKAKAKEMGKGKTKGNGKGSQTADGKHRVWTQRIGFQSWGQYKYGSNKW